MGSDDETGRRLASRSAHPSSLARSALRRQTPKVGAGCSNWARPDLRGGCAVMCIPTAILGRVEMWRSGCRPNISVAAPFVWRCLTGSAVAPFPHPAHRTGLADLSGSAAIAGFCPHGSRRAALPQRALQGGPEAGRASVPSLMDNRFGEREDGQEPFVRRPGNATLLASRVECLTPELGDAGLERA